MSSKNDHDPDNKNLTRRDLLRHPFESLSRGRVSPAHDKVLAGRIPLTALEMVPEATLLSVVPVPREGWSVRVCEAGVAYEIDPEHRGFVPLEPEACAAARLFDGVSTLEQIAADLGSQLEVPTERSAAIVRRTFLALAMCEVYHPDGPLSPPDTPPQVGNRDA
jgi:hypothetical protein